MKISRHAFIKRIIGALAAVGIGAKVTGKKRFITVKEPDMHRIRREHTQRMMNLLVSEMEFPQSIILTKDIDSDFDEYAKRFGGGIDYRIGDQMRVRRPASYTPIDPNGIDLTRTRQNPDGTVSVTRTVKYTFDKP